MLKRKSVKGSSRRVGDDAEQRLHDWLNDWGLDFKVTKNSGAAHENGDLTIGDGSAEWMVESKFRAGDEPTIRIADWKAVRQKAEHHRRTPVLVCQTYKPEAKDQVVVLRLSDFLQLMDTLVASKRRPPDVPF